VWEAAAFASQLKLFNLIAIVDSNRTQAMGQTKDILDLNIISLFNSFGWTWEVCDGNDIDFIENIISKSYNSPYIIDACTSIGMGVSFMEGDYTWHYKPLTAAQYELALKEIDEL
jgi:transketolase